LTTILFKVLVSPQYQTLSQHAKAKGTYVR
jgi:hypothetical protein